MITVDQNSALLSLDQSLVPAPALVDGRTELDRLSFVAEFASLINFYDNTNTINGNWKPFILKDPVFLLAHISKTPFAKLHALYLTTCGLFEQPLQAGKGIATGVSIKNIAVVLNRLFDEQDDMGANMQSITDLLNRLPGQAVGTNANIGDITTALDQIFDEQASVSIHIKDIILALNRLFDQLTDVFIHIERWTFYMQRSYDYDLKNYVVNEIKTTFSPYLWAILALRESLFLSSLMKGIQPVKYYLFESFDDMTWKWNKDKSPYWQVLGMGDEGVQSGEDHITINAIRAYDALVRAGDKLFEFFNTIIAHAPLEYEKLSLYKNRYPDTTLLRAFEKLLSIHQEEQNGLALKHLQFYYKDILKQTEKPAVADQVFVCAALTKQNAAFQLPAGTVFDAGVDAQGLPVGFATQEEVSLNPATISDAYTLAKITGTLFSLYLQHIADPGTVQKDEQGKMTGWETFGGSPVLPAVAVKSGFILASPMLLLREGKRKIVFDILFKQEIDIAFFTGAAYYLSTQSDWLDVKPWTSFKPSDPIAKNTATITIELPETALPVVPYALNPEGFESAWPMLKMEFGLFSDPANPPVLQSVEITATVEGIKNFQLYNDYGALSTKTPFPLWGPAPLVNNAFIIGNDEIFSKPLDSLHIELNWDKLPDNFLAYYLQYNNYIAALKPDPSAATAGNTTDTAAKPKPKKSFLQKVGSVVRTVFTPVITLASFVGRIAKKVGIGVIRFLGYKSNATETPDINLYPFNNNCFTVTFEVLESHAWQPMYIEKMSKVIGADGQVSFVDYDPCKSCTPVTTVPKGLQLFSPIRVNLPPADTTDPNSAGTGNTPAAGSAGDATPADKKNTSVTPVAGSATTTANTIASTTTNTITTGTAQQAGEQAKPTFKCVFDSASYFGFNTPSDLMPLEAYPDLQAQPLKYTDASENGFMRMILAAPSVGFGSGLYPNLVSSIALQNAVLIFNKTKAEDLLPAGNLPFVPKLVSFEGHYSASNKYVFNTKSSADPVQCFLYSPFGKGILYDSTQTPSAYGNEMVTSVAGMQVPGLPLFPAFGYDGALFLAMDNVVPQNDISFYFQLARNYGNGSAQKTVDYFYLGDKGWIKTEPLTDETNKFNCSGIIKLNIPGDITNQSTVVPGNKYWITIAVKTDDHSLTSFSKTVFLKTNGIQLQRTGDDFLADTQAPALIAGSITKPQKAIPQIASILQPFASFGGKAAEDATAMNQRVSNRLKTKDRAVSSEDYHRLIKQAFNDIYYSKVDAVAKSVKVYIVKTVKDYTDANAFWPLITECKEGEIGTFLSARTPLFSNVVVGNFDFQYVKVTADVKVQPGFAVAGVCKKIEEALPVFLSPWIEDGSPHIKIDQGVNEAEVGAFIKTIEGVLTVSSVSFTSWIKNENDPLAINKSSLKPDQPNLLLVSAKKHDINPVAQS